MGDGVIDQADRARLLRGFQRLQNSSQEYDGGCMDIRAVLYRNYPSCFGKQLGVSACEHSCPVSDECYE